MNSESDPELANLFAASELSLPEAEFMLKLHTRLCNEQRYRRYIVVSGTIALLLIVGSLLLLVTEMIGPLVHIESPVNLLSYGLHTLGSLVLSPLSWLIAATCVVIIYGIYNLHEGI